MENRNCPKCGAAVGQQLASTRMTNCPHCGTSLFLQDGRFELAGEQGVLHDVPSLLTLGDRVTMDGTTWALIGQARFGYGRGTWDEFWATGDDGQTAWISVDEGDVIVQSQIAAGSHPGLTEPPLFMGSFTWRGTTYRVTELETARCEAFRGTLPEVMEVGETYRFANCTGEDGDVLSAEFWTGGVAWYRGRWVDPFDITRRAAS